MNAIDLKMVFEVNKSRLKEATKGVITKAKHTFKLLSLGD